LVGSNVTLTLTVTNHGPDPAAFVTLTNSLPAEMQFVSATSAAGSATHQSGEIVASLGFIQPGGAASLTIALTGLSAGEFTNNVAVGAATPDQIGANNTAFVLLSVTNAPGSDTNSSVFPATNAPPVLAPIADRVVHAGSLVEFTNVATDADLTNTLTFSLAPEVPTTAIVEPASGRFSWLTTDAETDRTNLFTVRVTDNGEPPLSDEKSFSITVVARPLIAGIAVNNGVVSVAWNSLIGQAYRLEYTTNLAATVWTAASPDIVATSTITSHTNAFNPAVWHFYRVRVLP
jgi:uncharacterized repeat protein (TIGR01451 family)